MGFSSGLEILFMLLAMGGGVQDFLDVVPTEEYWQAKKVQVTDKVLEAELAAPGAVGDITKQIDALADEVAANREAAAKAIHDMGPGAIPQLQRAVESGNPEIAARAKRLIQELQNSGGAKQVRTLMAIRTAGERKMQSLLPRLRELQKSKAPFVGDYASAAVAAIEGKPYTRSHVNSDQDPWLLPLDTRSILHLQITGDAKPVTGEELKRIMTAMAQGNPQANPDAAKKLIEQVIGIVDQTGNIRLDAISLGISGNVGPRSGHVVVLAHGTFDSGNISGLIAKASGKPIEMTDGVPSVAFEKSATLIFPGNGYVAMLAGPPETQLPTKELVAAIKAGGSGLKDVPEMKQLIAGLDTTATLWGVVQINKAMREAPVFSGIDTLTVVGRTLGGKSDFTIQAAGSNAGEVAGAVGMVNRGVDEARKEIRRELERQNGKGMAQFMQTVADLLETVKCQQDPADAKKATLTASIKAPPLSAIMGFIGGAMFESRPAAPMPPPPPPAPAPAPGLPQAPPGPGPVLPLGA